MSGLPADRPDARRAVVEPDRDGPAVRTASAWPLWSYLELGAFPSAVPCARLHARHVLREWQLAKLSDDVELLVSELVSNAVQASAVLAGALPGRAAASGVPIVRFWLSSDRHQVLIQVWDGCQRKPRQQQPGLAAESGRGLLLVEAVSAAWGSYVPDGSGGKVVWAVAAK